MLATIHLGMLKFLLEGNQSTLQESIAFICSEKKQSLIFFNNMDDVSFMQSYYGQSAVTQKEVSQQGMRNRTGTLS